MVLVRSHRIANATGVAVARHPVVRYHGNLGAHVAMEATQQAVANDARDGGGSEVVMRSE